uniref:DUF6534 domain-containing protein n=1 Tax=Mycena chlorophos TaxID=658473 RepID=A0ABQ0LLE7_MYCCL|nr:predicted protein [Mycena chlorophos]
MALTLNSTAAAAAALEQAAILAAFNPNPMIGAILIGTLVSSVLYGISTAQCYLYYTRFPMDSPRLKILVAIVWIFETINVASAANIVYFYAVSNYGNPLSFEGKEPTGLILVVLLGAMIAGLVQSFFAFRIWVLAPNIFFKIIPVMIWACAVLFNGLCMADVVLSFQAPSIRSFLSHLDWLILVPNSINVFNDVTITMSLIIVLSVGEPDNLVWIGILVVKARLFANSLLVSLNSRASLRALDTKTISMRGGLEWSGAGQASTFNIGNSNLNSGDLHLEQSFQSGFVMNISVDDSDDGSKLSKNNKVESV